MKNLNTVFNLLLLPFLFLIRFSLFKHDNVNSKKNNKRANKKLLFVIISSFFIVSMAYADPTTIPIISIDPSEKNIAENTSSVTLIINASPAPNNDDITVTYTNSCVPSTEYYATIQVDTSSITISIDTSTLMGGSSCTITLTDSVSGGNSQNDGTISTTLNTSIINVTTGDLILTKTDSIDPVEVNSTFLYYINVTNNTDTNVTNLELQDPLPTNVTLNSINNSSLNTDGNWSCTTNLNTINCTLLSLDINGTIGLELNVTAPSTAQTLLNIASLTADDNISAEDATANTTVVETNTSIGGGINVSLYQIDTVDEFIYENYTTNGPIIKTKISAMSNYPFNLVHLDPFSLLPTTYRGEQEGLVVPLTVLLYLADDDCNKLENVYLTGEDDALARVRLDQGDISADITSPVLMPSLAIPRARILAFFDDLNDNNLTESELRCVLRSSTIGNLGDLPQCFNSETRLVEVFEEGGADCLNLFTNNSGPYGPCSSQYGTPGSPAVEPYTIEPACYSCLVGGSDGECSRDNFAIRPEQFDVNITSGDILISGKPINLAFEALDANSPQVPTLDYNETQNTSFYIDLNVSNNTGCQIKNLTITPSVNFQDGIHQDNFSFNDIGDINMSIHETNGTEFAIVDNTDTPLEDRLIQEYNASFTVIPDHFNIDANLTDHNSDNNFTYLHDINLYDNDDSYSMAAALTVNIQAMGADNTITRNYMETCYAKDTNLTLGLGGTNITYPGAVPLTQFLYYNPVEDNGTAADMGEGNYSLASLTDINRTISITSLPIENIGSTFPADAPDGNGTTQIVYKLNFDRKQNLVVNPFKMQLTDVNITDTDAVAGTTGTLTNQISTLYYARTKPSQFFYDDVTEASAITPILIDVYCDLGLTACDSFGINTIWGQTNESEWWLSWHHNRNVGDGNVTLTIDLPDAVIEGAGSPSVDTDVIITAQGKDENINVTSNATTLPMTVEIDLDESNPTDTNHWLIYNPSSAIGTPTPFYKVRFIGQSGWAGHGDTGYVVETNSSSKKNKRLEW